MIMIQNVQHSQAKYVIKIFKRLLTCICSNKQAIIEEQLKVIISLSTLNYLCNFEQRLNDTQRIALPQHKSDFGIVLHNNSNEKYLFYNT